MNQPGSQLNLPGRPATPMATRMTASHPANHADGMVMVVMVMVLRSITMNDRGHPILQLVASPGMHLRRRRRLAGKPTPSRKRVISIQVSTLEKGHPGVEAEPVRVRPLKLPDRSLPSQMERTPMGLPLTTGSTLTTCSPASWSPTTAG